LPSVLDYVDTAAADGAAKEVALPIAGAEEDLYLMLGSQGLSFCGVRDGVFWIGCTRPLILATVNSTLESRPTFFLTADR
jgi:hypothetical protein